MTERAQVDHLKVHAAERLAADLAAARKQIEELKADRDPRWVLLSAPFELDWIEKLPKQVKRGDEVKGRCLQGKEGNVVSADGHFCGGWHARSVHLDYVGHAGITMRLNDVMGPGGWTYRALGHDPNTGTPVIGKDYFAAELTIMGATHWDVAASYTSPQEAYGDCLRRCAMRFGIGTYLWSKSERAAALAEFKEPDPGESQARQVMATNLWNAAEADLSIDNVQAKWREAVAHGVIDEPIHHMNGDTEPLRTALERLGKNLAGQSNP